MQTAKANGPADSVTGAAVAAGSRQKRPAKKGTDVPSAS